jgi:NADPH2:quinone reductase
MATIVRENGGPEVMKWEETEVGAPGEGQLRVKIAYAGLNYIDVYHRTGLYPVSLPTGIGLEASGTVLEAGGNAGDFAEGDRIAFCTAGLGSYARERLIDASAAVKLSDDVSLETAAAMILKGLTVWYLVSKTYPVKAGDSVVFHAAVGGVGKIACQWLKQIGARVIGVVGSGEKAEAARSLGCDLVLVHGRDDLVSQAREFTSGRGAQVVYDSVGKDTFEESIKSLAPRGLMVSFGNSSGPVDPVPPLVLSANGSLFLTRPTLKDYTSTPEELREGSAALFEAHRKGVKIEIGRTFPLEQAADAHRALEARQTTGSTILAA